MGPGAAQSAGVMFEPALGEVPGAVIQPDGDRVERKGFQYDDVPIVIAIDIAQAETNGFAAAIYVKRSRWGVTEVNPDLVCIAVAVAKRRTRRNQIDNTVAIEIRQRPARRARGHRGKLPRIFCRKPSATGEKKEECAPSQ